MVGQGRRRNKKNTYKARHGAPFSDTQAQVYGEAIEKIIVKCGEAKPRDVVIEAENPKSPLHPYFDWDDEVAGKKHRLHQARMMLGSIVKVTVFKEEVKEHRAFVNVTVAADNGKKSRKYVTLETALTREEYRQQVLNRALKELKYWRNLYSDYNELAPIFEAIDGIT